MLKLKGLFSTAEGKKPLEPEALDSSAAQSDSVTLHMSAVFNGKEAHMSKVITQQELLSIQADKYVADLAARMYMALKEAK